MAKRSESAKYRKGHPRFLDAKSFIRQDSIRCVLHSKQNKPTKPSGAAKPRRKEKIMTYIQIQNEIIEKFRIDICDGTKCESDWRRTHAHPKERRVCKWKQANSVASTFTLLHEVGHIVADSSSNRRCESEFAATAWAIDQARKYGFIDKIPERTKDLYQSYIFREHERGVRRGGRWYPSREKLTLMW